MKGTKNGSSHIRNIHIKTSDHLTTQIPEFLIAADASLESEASNLYPASIWIPKSYAIVSAAAAVQTNMKLSKAGMTAGQVLSYCFRASAHQEPLIDHNTTLAATEIQWNFNFSSEAPHHFASAYGLLQQWSNTFFPNGHSLVPCEIRPLTKLYHGRRDGDVPPSPEWLAFDMQVPALVQMNIADTIQRNGIWNHGIISQLAYAHIPNDAESEMHIFRR